MKAVIGKRLLEEISPRAKPYEIRDARLPGFSLRIQPSGHMSYICQYGRAKRVTIGNATVLTPVQARDRAKLILADACQGIEPKQKKAHEKHHTLGTFLDEEYGPWYQQNHRRGDSEIKRLEHNFNDVLDKPLADISLWAIEKWRMKRLKNGINPVTVNRDIAPLKTALSRAVDWEFLAENPLTRLKPSKTVHIPAQADHRFRRKPITHSGPSRSLIPAQADHRSGPSRSLLAPVRTTVYPHAHPQDNRHAMASSSPFQRGESSWPIRGYQCARHARSYGCTTAQPYLTGRLPAA